MKNPLPAFASAAGWKIVLCRLTRSSRHRCGDASTHDDRERDWWTLPCAYTRLHVRLSNNP